MGQRSKEWVDTDQLDRRECLEWIAYIGLELHRYF